MVESSVIANGRLTDVVASRVGKTRCGRSGTLIELERISSGPPAWFSCRTLQMGGWSPADVARMFEERIKESLTSEGACEPDSVLDEAQTISGRSSPGHIV